MSGTRRIKRRIRKRIPFVQNGGNCGCSSSSYGGSTRQLGGSVSFPASFGGTMNGVNQYPLNTFGGDPTHTPVQSRLMGGGKSGRKDPVGFDKRPTRVRRRTRRRGRRTRRGKMHGGNFLGGLTPMNQTLGGNMVMNAGTFMAGATMK